MQLAKLIKSGLTVVGNTDINIKGIAYDSRQVSEGFIFFAMKGERLNGVTFINEAIQRGAVAVAIMREDFNSIVSNENISWILTDDIRDTLAYMASVFYDSPSEKIKLIGITGTNGKTSTSYIIKSIFDCAGQKTGIVGTIRYIIDLKSVDAPHTTPEAPDFQRVLSEMLSSGCKCCASEISSHALIQRRVDYSRFTCAIFTNLTPEHLDFHKNMTQYYLAKERLFTELLMPQGTAIINIDDEYGKILAQKLQDKRIVIKTFAIDNKSADIVATDIEYSFKGTSFSIVIDRIKHMFNMQIIGITGVYNALAAISTALSMQIPIEKIKEGVKMISCVSGRFEKVDLGQDFLAVVDYAHTADALEKLLLTARQLLKAFKIAQQTDMLVKSKQWQLTGFSNDSAGTGKIITVFGCGGNRDRTKRAKMGEVAAKHSDFVIITSDNPRNEDPKGIIRDIEKGIKSDNYVVIPDRNVAIGLAVELASHGDIVLVAGKGHEQYQEIKGERFAFSDKLALENAIKKTISRQNYTKSNSSVKNISTVVC